MTSTADAGSFGYPPSMLVFTATLTLAQAAPTHAQIVAADWKLATTTTHRDAGEVRIYRAEVAGVPCFRGTATVGGVTVDGLLETAIDVEGAIQWASAGVTQGRILERSATHVDYFQFLDVPGWTLASDRFWFLTGRIQRHGDVRVFHWSRLIEGGKHKAVYDEIRAAHPKAVEPPVNVGGWEFRTEADQVAVRYEVCTNTGGQVPRAVQNVATRRTLPDNIGDVVRQARTLR